LTKNYRNVADSSKIVLKNTKKIEKLENIKNIGIDLDGDSKASLIIATRQHIKNDHRNLCARTTKRIIETQLFRPSCLD